MSDQKIRVLLVDDEPSIIKMVGKRLEVEGFELIVARDGKEALTKARKEQPDLIVLDLMLPKVDGFDVCAALKRGKDTMGIPVIVMFSGKGSPEDEERCQTLGAAAFITKKQGTAPLIEKIRELLAHVKRKS